MKYLGSVFLLVAALLVPQKLASQSRETVISGGTLITCTLNEPNFSAKTATVGEPLICSAGPLRVFGQPALPRGSFFVGHLNDYRDPGRLAGKGWLALEFDRLILPHAEVPVTTKVVFVRGYRVDAEGRILGKGHPKRDAFGWMLPILWPVKIITLPMRGPYLALKGELPITLRLLDDAAIPELRDIRTPLSYMGPEPHEYETASREHPKRPLTERIPILDSLKHLANPFLGPKDYGNRRVEQTLGGR